MSTWVITYLPLVLGWVAVLYVKQRHRKSAQCQHSLPLPPGPPGLPWIGNVIGVNLTAPWITYSSWSKTYGDIIYSRLFGRDIIIINSERIARDLLEKRSGNYSDRPYLITNDLCGISFNSAMMPYGDRWRLHRRFFHETFRTAAIPGFLPVLHRKACRLLQRLLDTPEQLDEHIFEYTASVILNSVYDYDPPAREDELVDILAKVLRIVIPALDPGVAIVVGAFPALLNFPSWLPGMSFKRKMSLAREFAGQYVEKPFAHCLQKMPSDNITSSMVHGALRNMEEKGTPPDKYWISALKEAAATAFLAASETSNSVLMTFFLIMMANHGVQEKAQAQIDAVVGRTRLPTSDDRPSLPYIDAIFREMLRFGPSAPLSVPHATLDDDVYAGFHIPKGVIVFANLWSMMHDETRYPNPHIFLPERFLNGDGTLKPNDIKNIAFGFGRRICVGRHFVDASIWSVIVKVLAVFTILKPLDENGAEIPVELKFSSGPSVHPLPFRCRIVPRVPGMDADKLQELIVASSN